MNFAAFRFCTALALVTLAGSSVACAQVAVPAAEQQLLEDVRDGELQQFEFVDAALIASGLGDRDARAAALQRRDEKYAALELQVIVRLPATERPAALLGLMHSQLLTGAFRPTATLVHETLATGDFNCVTATILFHDLCPRVGVSAEIIAQSGHVSSRLVNLPSIEIETTRADWFSKANVPKSDQPRRVISPAELLGRIYYNRALAALEKREFAQAIELLQNSLVCDSRDHDARENLLAGLNNWALALCEQGEYAAAARRITTGLSLNAAYQPLLGNDLHVHQQWVAHLCREAEFTQALQVLEAGKQRRPAAPLFTSGQRAVYESWIKHCTANGDATAAAQVLRQAQQALGPQANLRLEARPMPKVISAKSRSENSNP